MKNYRYQVLLALSQQKMMVLTNHLTKATLSSMFMLVLIQIFSF